MIKPIFAAVLVALLFFVSPLVADETITGRVVRVADGDTITIQTEAQGQVKVRLYGIDCPEGGQAFGRAARREMVRLVDGREVTVEPVDVDRYKRTVGIVTVSGQDAGGEMVKAGLAWVYPQYCKRADICQGYREAEEAARGERRGLWQEREPVPPWDWRKRK
jgi:endonuclease YncB( thermonuclease family)